LDISAISLLISSLLNEALFWLLVSVMRVPSSSVPMTLSGRIVDGPRYDAHGHPVGAVVMIGSLTELGESSMAMLMPISLSWAWMACAASR